MAEEIARVTVDALVRASIAAGVELEVLAGRAGLDRAVGNPYPQKAGLALAGFDAALQAERVLVFGQSEVRFLTSRLDAATRQVIARVAGRVFAPNEGASAPAAVGDALITAMNDKDALVRRWAMDSLGWMKFEHAIQALTDRASYYGKNEEGAGALHAVARIASSGSAPVLRALLANTYIPFRLLSIEGLGRIGDQGSLPAINESATGVNDAGVSLAASYARFMLGQADVVAIADALEHPDIAVQAKVYLAEIAVLKPDAIHALLRTPNPSTRMLAAEILGASQHVDEIATLEPLLKDPAPEVVEVASEAIRRLRAYGTVAKP